jgi:Sortase domain
MSKPQHHGRRRLPPVAVLAVVLLLAGAALLAGALRSQHHAPQPPTSAAVPFQPSRTRSAASAAVPPRATAPSSSRPSGPMLRRALPLHLSIPNIGVETDLLQLGLNPDRTVQVPPLSRHSEAGWYRYSPAPGQLGPSVILGHVDSAEYGPAVFFRLGALRPGNRVSVTRADNTVAVFRIDRVVAYPKDHFPTLTVYGNTDNAALRLITCGGRFDLSTRNYESNIVAYASLVSSHRA